MLTISKPVGRGRKGDEDIVGKDSRLVITLVCDRTFQSITPEQICSSFSPKERKSHTLSSAYRAVLVFLIGQRFPWPLPAAVVRRAWVRRRRGFCTPD